LIETYGQVLGRQGAQVPQVGVHLLQSLLVLLLLGVGELDHQGRRAALQHQFASAAHTIKITKFSCNN